MKGSLRRTLALRFAATMAAGLLLSAAAFYWAASRALEQPVPTAVLEGDLLIALLAVVLAGTAATLMGAWHFTSSAVRPVAEITAQATRIEAGTLDQRIAAHADTEEYEGLVAVLNRMLERLERGFAAQRRLTADVSHELRTPLTALRGQIEVALRAERSPREYQLVLRSGLEEIERLTTLCEDLLLITRADAGLLAAHRVPTDVLSNAVRHSPEGETITVRVEGASPEVRFRVVDRGSGVPAELRERIFEPFERFDPLSGLGTGLGLPVSRRLAEVLGGRLVVEETQGGGATFVLVLPMKPSSDGL